MKFTTTKSALLEALKSTGQCIGTNIIPALNCYRFNITGNELEITGGNMEVFLKTKIDISGSLASLSVGVPSTRLLGLIQELPDQALEFSFKEKIEKTEKGEITKYDATILASSGKYVIPCENGNDYPEFQIENAINFNILTASLFEGIDKCLFAIHKEMTNALGGINIKFGDTNVTFFGCDNFVLSTKSFELEEAINSIKGFVIPPKVLSVLRTLQCDEIIPIELGERNILFKLNDTTTIQSVLLENKYPDASRIIPVSNDKHLFIDRAQLIGSLKRVSQFANPATHAIKLNLVENLCSLASSNEFGEKAGEDLNIDYNGGPFNIEFNAKLLVSCLSKFDCEQIHLSFGTHSLPIIIRDNNTELSERKNCMMLMPFGK